MIKLSKSTPSYKFAISLQCLKRAIFLHADKHQRFYKLTLSFLMKVARHVQRTQNTKLVIFLHHLNKKVSQLLLRSVVMQNCVIFRGF